MANVKMSVRQLIQSDLHRYAGTTRFRDLLQQYFFNAGFCYSFWFRVSQSDNPLWSLVGRGFKRILGRRYLIDIPSTVTIGPGLYLSHPMAIVLNPTTVIGRNCNLSQFTTIGANHGQAANIGDYVYIGPDVSLVENISIGNDATIGAGAVVVKDIPEGATAAGNPAQVISWKPGRRYIKHPYEP